MHRNDRGAVQISGKNVDMNIMRGTYTEWRGWKQDAHDMRGAQAIRFVNKVESYALAYYLKIYATAYIVILYALAYK